MISSDIGLASTEKILNKIKEKHSKIKFKQELTRLWVHGFTHLLGYDHKKDKEFYKMRKVEKKIFQILIK